MARLSQESRRWARKEGRELKPTVERSESGARGEIHSPPSLQSSGSVQVGLRGVRVPNRHLG